MILGADPGRLSEAVAGVIHAGPLYRVAERLEERVKDEDDVYDEILDPDGELRQARVRALVTSGLPCGESMLLTCRIPTRTIRPPAPVPPPAGR